MAATTSIDAGMEAPPFDGTDEQGHRHRLAEYRGQTLLLCFLPPERPDVTPRDLYKAFPGSQRRDIFLLGVQQGTVRQVGDWKRRNQAPFPVLADPRGSLCAAYGMTEALTRGRSLSFALIGPDGVLRLLLKRVDSPRHVYELLKRAAPGKRRTVRPRSRRTVKRRGG